MTVLLLANGEKIAEAVLSESNDWQYTFKGLDLYSNGQRITYTIREISPVGYTSVITGNKLGCTITNTSTETIKIPVRKQWFGTAAESVTVNLMADGSKIDEAVLNESNNWRFTFTDLRKYDSTDGHEIKYTLQEVSIKGYVSEITETQDGYTITNTETTEIPVEKKWEGTAGKSVTINLLADGKAVAKTVLNADNSWKHVFTDLPKYDKSDGHKIVYTVSENPVSGYTASISGDADSGFVVTNKQTPSTPSSSSSGTPKTGDETKVSLYLWMMIISGLGLIAILFAGRKRFRKDKS